MSLVNTIKADVANAHLRQQIGRFLRLFTFAVASQLTVLGTGHLDRSALTGVAVGGLEVAFRQLMPVAAWRSLAERLHLVDAVRPTAAPAQPPVTPVPPPTGPEGGASA